MGRLISAEGITPDPEKIKPVRDMPNPVNVKEVQRLLGMVNFLAPFIPNMSQLTSPFRTLIKKNAQWMGEHEQDRSRKIINETLSRASVLNLYDPKGKPQSSVMPLQDDWSRSLARQPACGICIKIAQQTEKNYTQIQEEMLQLFSQRNTSISIFMDKMCRSSAIVSCFR